MYCGFAKLLRQKDFCHHLHWDLRIQDLVELNLELSAMQVGFFFNPLSIIT